MLEDLIFLERNKLYVGDAWDLCRHMPNNSVDLIVTSPPYNCGKNYGACSDEIPWPEYYAFMDRMLDEFYRVLDEGGTLAIVVPGAMRWQRKHRYKETWADFDRKYRWHSSLKEYTYGKGRIEPLGFRLFEMMWIRDRHMREPVMWVKGTEQLAVSATYRMGSDNDPYMRSVHEWILLGSKGRWYHRGGTGRRGSEAVPFADYTKDVWFIPPVSSRKHPATFPEEIPLRLIRLFVHAEDALVLDPFIGIGTTALACLTAGIPFLGFDANEQFIATARKRVEERILELGSEMELPFERGVGSDNGGDAAGS